MPALSHPSRRGARCPDAGGRRLRRRLAGLAAIVLATTTIAFGEAWLYRDAPAVTVESAVGDGVAHALDQGLGVD